MSCTVEQNYDVIIIGGGPAGLAAGLYTARGKLKTLLLEQMATGGQAATTHIIENYPGFPQGVEGPKLADFMTEQAERFGLKVDYSQITGLKKTEEGFLVLSDDDRVFSAKALIITSGAEPRKMGVPREKEMTGFGVSYCATCDGAFYQDKEIAIVGGGDTAIEDAIYLTRYASKVTLIHRRDQLRATKVLQERALVHPKIDFVWNTVVKEIQGSNHVEGLVLKELNTNKEKTIRVDGVFVAIGYKPNSGFVGDLMEKDGNGYIITNKRMETSCPGIYAAGDVCQKELRQVITAASDGAIAGHCVQNWLSEKK